MSLTALIVRAVHVGVIAFVLLAPFSSDPSVVRAHVWLVPFLWVHWLLNNDACALTVLECKLRGVPTEASFVHSVVSPVYRITQTSAKTLAWVASLLVWGVAVWRAMHMHIDLRPWVPVA
jgi:hypothetical protein